MNEALKLKVLKVILLSQLLIEANDDIKETVLYRDHLKVFGRQYINQLGLAIKQTDAVYAENPEIYTNLTKNLEALVEKFAECSTHDLVMINKIHEHYKAHKADWDALFDTQIEPLN